MLKTIAASYKIFLKNFPVILLFALPLLVISGIEIYFQGLNNASKGVTYFIALAIFLLPLISAATDIAVYRRLFGFESKNPFICLKTLFLYLFTQIGLGLIATLPIFLFKYIFGMFVSCPFTCMALSIFLNMFIGIYILARFNIILALLVQNKVPSLQEFLDYTRKPYAQWLLVSFLVYLPYILINYLVPNPYANMILTSLLMLVFVCFNTAYVTTHKPLKTKEIVTESCRAKTVRAEPVYQEEKPAPAKKPEKKAKPAEKKAPVKAPVKKGSAKKPAVKKPLTPKKPVLAKA